MLAARLPPTLALVALLFAAFAPVTADANEPDPCRWTARTIVGGLGVLENVEPDGRGGLLISSSDRDAVERVLPDGTVTTFAADVDRPGGLRVRGNRLFVTTGNGLASGLLGTPDGTLLRIDLDSGERTVISEGLVMPNGLVFDHAGDAYVSRDFGPGGAITRIPLADPVSGPSPPERAAGEPERWAAIADTNGLAVSADGRFMYAVETFTLPSNVYRIEIADPTRIDVIASLFLAGGGVIPKGLDDIEIDADDVLYITANSAGEVIRLDPATGDTCVIASGLLLPSAVKFGHGPGWPSDHLYVVGFGGAVVELAPPPGATPGRASPVEPAPPPAGVEPGPEDDADPDPEPALPATGGSRALPAALLVVVALGIRRRSWSRP